MQLSSPQSMSLPHFAAPSHFYGNPTVCTCAESCVSYGDKNIILNSWYLQYVRRQRLPKKGDIFQCTMGKSRYGESARNTNYTVTNVTDCI